MFEYFASRVNLEMVQLFFHKKVRWLVNKYYLVIPFFTLCIVFRLDGGPVLCGLQY